MCASIQRRNKPIVRQEPRRNKKNKPIAKPQPSTPPETLTVVVGPIEKKYEELLAKPSDINEHLPTLKKYAAECSHITEFGVRTAVSTVALLHGKPDYALLASYDIEPTWGTDALLKIARENKINRKFNIGDTRKITIRKTDMLFIDTRHDYDLLKVELALHANKVKKYIIFHDVVTYGEKGETPGKEGINRAIKEFQQDHPERVTKELFTNNNGLLVLERAVSKPKVTVYTAIYGKKDVLKHQIDQDISIQWVCFTDDPELPCEPGAKKQREIRVIQHHKHLHPRMQAKYFRMHPYEFLDTDTVVWMDGSARLLKKDSISHFVNQMLPESDILTFQHPERNCIVDEAEFCTSLGKPHTVNKYKGLPMMEQVRYYLKKGFPKQYGLTGTGLLITKNSNPKIRDFFHKRWCECLAWTYQDQLSFEPLVYFEKIKRQWVQEYEWDNEYIDYKGGHNHYL